MSDALDFFKNQNRALNSTIFNNKVVYIWRNSLQANAQLGEKNYLKSIYILLNQLYFMYLFIYL